MSTSSHCLVDLNRTNAAPVDYDGILNLEWLKLFPSGDDFTSKHKFVAPDNIAIKMNAPLAGTAAESAQMVLRPLTRRQLALAPVLAPAPAHVLWV